MAYQSYESLVSEIRVSLDVFQYYIHQKKDEIQKLILEEDLSETKRAQYILMKGQDRQKLAIYQNLGKILKLGFDSLFNIVQADIMEQNEELVILAGKSLININQHAKEILPVALHFISLYNLPLAEAWLPTFGNLIKQIDYKEYQEHIENMILDISKPHQPEVGRLIGAMMIIQVTELLGDKIQGPLLDRVRQLCNDSDAEVRSMIAGSVLNCLITQLSPLLIQQYIEDKLQSLIYDKSPKVKKSMIQTFFTNLIKINQNQSIANAPQIFIDCLSTANEDVLITSLTFCGLAYVAIQDLIDLEFQQNFTNLYVKLGRHGNPDIRKLYLYNLPGILNYTKDESLRIELFQPFCTIIDEDSIENKILSCRILHEVANIFDASVTQTQIYFILNQIIDSGDIQCILQIELDTIFEKFYSNKNVVPPVKLQDQYKSVFQDYSKLFDKCSQNYKLNEKYLFRVKSFQKYVKARQFEKYFLPILYQKQTSPQNDQLAMEIVAQYFGTCKSYDEQSKIKDVMNLMFSRGNSNKKIKYLHFISYLPQFISRKYFHSLNFHQISSFSKDKAVNVVIQMIRIFPKIHHYLTDHNEYTTLKNNFIGGTLLTLFNQMIHQIEQHGMKIDDSQQKMLEQQEEKNYQEYISNLKQLKQQDSSSSIDYHSKQKKRPIPKLNSISAKKPSTSQLKIGKQEPDAQPQSRSQDRTISQKCVNITKFRSRPSGFNKF